jgi:hypothetical protein
VRVALGKIVGCDASRFVDMGLRGRRKPLANALDVTNRVQESVRTGEECILLCGVGLTASRGTPGAWFAGLRKYSNLSGERIGSANDMPTKRVVGLTAWTEVTIRS